MSKLIRQPKAYLHRGSGFSLVELMTVISLAALVLAVTFPVFNSINRGTRIASSVNALKGAMASTQMHATRDIADKEFQAEGVSVPYQGGALLVEEITDGSESRLRLTVMEHNQSARQEVSGAAELMYEKDEKGFWPVGRLDPVLLPVGAGMVGVVRKEGTEDEDGLKFLWPPFAIMFDERGKILAGSSPSNPDYRMTQIDANGNGEYGEDISDYDNQERLSSVSFIILFDRTAYEAAGYDSSAFRQMSVTNQATDYPSERAWLRSNGKLLYMTRFSGVIMRENGVGETLVK